MSVEITAKIICDHCGASVEAKQTHTTAWQTAYWLAKRAAKKQHWMFNQRYGPTTHICEKCADCVPSVKDRGAEKLFGQ